MQDPDAWVTLRQHKQFHSQFRNRSHREIAWQAFDEDHTVYYEYLHR